ncbi:MAG: bifunctional demethylmenaquinone methyltransferase/2-methoxy-6-polyprenyl-1,4-benzoquinol methylase UbiE [Flavobacteriales bacterium]|nr:bifunctional demethylmenaquinone methyltransferase/2-methoxy-6-polyprenyl-1,4-benzoquinol methylase UbiE [Flavobacteriales bacterium]
MGTRITPYVTPEEEAKKNQVARMFDGIAHRYDFLNHFFSLGIDVLWRKACIRMLRKESPSKLLDVATGTADFAIEAVRMGLDVHVTGVDISAGMLDVGREKIAARGWNDKIELIQGDSVALPFEDDTFDAYIVAFGVRNFEDLQGGLGDMLRVLKPGALGLVLEFSKPKHFPIKQVFGLYFKHIMPTVGKWVSKDPSAYTYLPESVQAFPEGEAFLDQMRQAGYRDVQARSLTGGIATIYTGRKPQA